MRNDFPPWEMVPAVENHFPLWGGLPLVITYFRPHVRVLEDQRRLGTHLRARRISRLQSRPCARARLGRWALLKLWPTPLDRGARARVPGTRGAGTGPACAPCRARHVCTHTREQLRAWTHAVGECLVAAGAGGGGLEIIQRWTRAFFAAPTRIPARPARNAVVAAQTPGQAPS